MRLRKPCSHGKYDAHGMIGFEDDVVMVYDRSDCPGGVFLPDDTLIIEKENGEWPESAIQILEQYHYPCPPEFQEQVIKWLPTDVLDILAGDLGE